MAYERIQRGYKRGGNTAVIIMIALIAVLLVAVIVLLAVGSPFQKDRDTAETSSVSSAPAVSQEQGATEDQLKAVAEAGQWYLKLVNQDNKLDQDHNPELQVIEARYNPNRLKFDVRAIDALNQMCADAEKDGVSLVVISAYRSISKQTTLYNNKVDRLVAQGQSREDALVAAATEVALPGTSEHNLGLAVDFNSTEQDFENTKACKWLKENAEKYGFVNRFPADKQELTKIIYEPWHYRYVTVEHAAKMNELNMCLEEYVPYLQNGGRPVAQ
ncbi:MAG: M15 family metallopeptidase [Clostridiales bacterium]|nr:M15 family metallopeptidase [Clostridiales bacterium]